MKPAASGQLADLGEAALARFRSEMGVDPRGLRLTAQGFAKPGVLG